MSRIKSLSNAFRFKVPQPRPPTRYRMNTTQASARSPSPVRPFQPQSPFITPQTWDHTDIDFFKRTEYATDVIAIPVAVSADGSVRTAIRTAHVVELGMDASTYLHKAPSIEELDYTPHLTRTDSPAWIYFDAIRTMASSLNVDRNEAARNIFEKGVSAQQRERALQSYETNQRLRKSISAAVDSLYQMFEDKMNVRGLTTSTEPWNGAYESEPSILTPALHAYHTKLKSHERNKYLQVVGLADDVYRELATPDIVLSPLHGV